MKCSCMHGAGKQTIGVVVNLSSRYGIALPLALLGGFHFKWSVEGMVAGILVGPFCQAVSLPIIAFRFDWERLALQASLAAAKGRCWK